MESALSLRQCCGEYFVFETVLQLLLPLCFFILFCYQSKNNGNFSKTHTILVKVFLFKHNYLQKALSSSQVKQASIS